MLAAAAAKLRLSWRDGTFRYARRPMSSSQNQTDDVLEFPEGFLWGVATSAHQIEGGNVNNDWWAFEHRSDTTCAESSGDACDSWHHWLEDVELVRSLGLGAYRFSLEWSRVEPAEGEWSRAALDHYRRICSACLERGIAPVVTFHHFTIPLWLANRGGWEARDAPDRFARFVEQASGHLGDVMGWACTLNEPNVVAVLGYMQGTYPPGVSDLQRYDHVNRTLARAHRLAGDVLRAGPGDFPIGLTLSLDELVACEGGEVIRDAAQQMLEDTFLEATTDDDFVGVQPYSRILFGPEGELPPPAGARLTAMGTEYWPHSVEYAIRRVTDATGLPVMVTESGIAAADDNDRIEYLAEALQGVYRAIQDGCDVPGFFVWSLLDNFEWDRGFAIRFGVAEVDPSSFGRRPKPSAHWYGQVARRNGVKGPA